MTDTMTLDRDNAAEVAAWCGGRTEVIYPVAQNRRELVKRGRGAAPTVPEPTTVVFLDCGDGEGERWLFPGARIDRTPGGYAVTDGWSS